jgi:hypothetical protein
MDAPISSVFLFMKRVLHVPPLELLVVEPELLVDEPELLVDEPELLPDDEVEPELEPPEDEAEAELEPPDEPPPQAVSSDSKKTVAHARRNMNAFLVSVPVQLFRS